MATVSENLTAINNTKQAIKQAIADKGVSMDNVPFTQYAEKITEIQAGGGGVESSTGNVTQASGYQAITIAHGLSKAPKLFTFFLTDYANVTGMGVCGFTYTGKIATVYRNGSTTTPTILAANITVPNHIVPSYGAISVDDTNIYVKSTSSSWTAGDYSWEAYTW
jgi:hypothetical protein